jgi:ribosomal protein L19
MRLSEDPKKLLVGVRDNTENVGIEYPVPIATAIISEVRTIPTAVAKRRRPY